MTTTFPLSASRIANEGAAYTAPFIGAQAVFTTWEGQEKVGVVESIDITGVKIRFADGTWARGTLADSLIQTR